MRAVIIVEKGVQDEEYIYPYYRLQEAGFKVDVAVKDESVDLKGKYGIPIRSTIATVCLREENYDCAVIPGGWESPERVRQDRSALKFLNDMHRSGKVIAAICHGPWVLISAGICKDRRMTCYVGMKDDLENAGATYVDQGVVVDGNIVTSPHYRNNPEFMRETLKLVKEVSIKDYSDVIVNKPWGYEYLVTQNEKVGIWYLNLKPGEQTSLHSHPNKKTGLIVLKGDAKISFLNGSHHLTPGDKIMIRNGVFHSTKNIGSENLELIEIETPNDKEDIIRLEDAYGRSGKPYEGEDHYEPKKLFWDLINGQKIGNCELKQVRFNSKEELLDLPDSKIIIVSGKLESNGNDVLTAGDVVDNVVLKKLAAKFDPVLPIIAITVSC